MASGHTAAVNETLSEPLNIKLNAKTNTLGEVKDGLDCVQRDFVPEKGNKATLETYKCFKLEASSRLLNICVENNEDLFIIEATLGGRPVKLLVDSGANGNFIPERLVRYLHLKIEKNDQDRKVILADGRRYPVDTVVNNAVISLKGATFKFIQTLIVVPIEIDVILGKPWLSLWNHEIDWCKNEMTLNYEGERVKIFGNKDKKLSLLPPIGATKLKSLLRKREVEVIYATAVERIEYVTEETKIPRRIRNLVEEYSDVFVEQIPAGLPPKRDIEHGID